MMLSDLRKETEKYESYQKHKDKDYFCSQNGLHKYEKKGEDNNLLVEVCHCCSKEIRFIKTKEGRIDSTKYGESHILYFMQHTHPFYEHFYGKYKELNLKDTKKEFAELRRELKDDERTWSHLGTKVE